MKDWISKSLMKDKNFSRRVGDDKLLTVEWRYLRSPPVEGNLQPKCSLAITAQSSVKRKPLPREHFPPPNLYPKMIVPIA